MQVEMHVPQRINSLAFNMRQWMSSLEEKCANSYRKIDAHLSEQQVRDAIPTVSIIIGAAAFGLWRNSFGAALFAGIALFFLASIHGELKRVVAAVSRREREPMATGNMKRETPAIEPRRSEIATKAIERLQPWVAGETSLTEEDAKTCCAALIKS
ncbi:MAG TPA: hypothetical protein VGQ71_12460 [Terriglobales bacterium]|jgi:hypothetical protein|nr:hypothetical protein [Terriglobales bacterium]